MLYVPYQQQQTHGPHLAQIQPPDTPRRLPRPRPPHALPHDERQVDAQAQQAKDAPVHARQVAGVALPGSKTSVVRNQGDGPRRADDGAKHVAEEDLDEGGGLVAAGRARHDDVGGDGGGDARREQPADEHGAVDNARRVACVDDAHEDVDADGADDEAEALHQHVEAPVECVDEEGAGRKAEPADEEDDGYGPVQNAVLGADDAAVRRDVWEEVGQQADEAEPKHQPLREEELEELVKGSREDVVA